MNRQIHIKDFEDLELHFEASKVGGVRGYGKFRVRSGKDIFHEFLGEPIDLHIEELDKVVKNIYIIELLSEWGLHDIYQTYSFQVIPQKHNPNILPE